jgi:hypothetical protein
MPNDVPRNLANSAFRVEEKSGSKMRYGYLLCLLLEATWFSQEAEISA